MERLELAKLLGWKRGQSAISGLHCFSPFDSAELRREFAAVAAGKGTFFLCDPNWGHREHDQLDEILAEKDEAPDLSQGWLCIPTGGTSGKLRFARHDQNTICAAVAGFKEHFGMESVNAVGVLPLHHVSGFMAWIRCALSGGRFVDWDWKDLEAGKIPEDTGGEDWVISLVPTQLQRLLIRPATVKWLRSFRVIFVGGAPAWPTIIERAAKEKLPISLSYGMTETAAMVSALRPSDFTAKTRCVGKTMPHAKLNITRDGLVHIESESIFRGYYPEWKTTRSFTSEDLGEWDEAGFLRILGRRDELILSGGKKIAPSEVEAALVATGLVSEVVVLGMPDAEWGQQVVAFVPEKLSEDAMQMVDSLMRESLSAYKRPKRYVVVDPWPKNDQGKVNREILRAAVEDAHTPDARSRRSFEQKVTKVPEAL